MSGKEGLKLKHKRFLYCLGGMQKGKTNKQKTSRKRRHNNRKRLNMSL